MLELRNSKTIELPRAADGRRRFTLDGFIGSVMMNDPMEGWITIKPRLVRVTDGWEVHRAPYYSFFGDDGSLLFCPNKYEKSKYLKVMGNPLWSKLAKKVLAAPTKIDGELLVSIISIPTEWGEIRWRFTNTADKLSMSFNKLPTLLGKTVDRLTLDIDSNGLDIAALLKSKEGLGIPQPRLIQQTDTPEAIQKVLDWNLKAGQLEVPLDFEGMKYPVQYVNSPLDVQVNNGTDDGQRSGATSFDRGTTTGSVGYGFGVAYHTFHRFQNVSASGTIDVSYMRVYPHSNGFGAPALKIYGVDEDNPSAPSTYQEFDADPLTGAGVDFNGVFTKDVWAQSGSLNGIFQELVDTYTIDNEAVMLQIRNNQVLVNGYNTLRFQEYAGNESGATLHLEWTEGGGEALEIFLFDTVTISDSLAKSIEKLESDNVTITDSLSKGIVLGKSDSVAISDTIGKNVELCKVDSVVISDAISKDVGLFKKDGVVINDAITKAIGLNKNDTVTITDNFDRVVNFVRYITDTVAIADSISKSLSKQISDSVVIADNMTKSLVPAPVYAGINQGYALSRSNL